MNARLGIRPCHQTFDLQMSSRCISLETNIAHSFFTFPQRTLDYLFHQLLPQGGFSETFNFIRDRSRAVRNDFTMQHEMGPIAIECHERCARFHILALHVERDRSGFSIAMEEQQLMNSKSISTQLGTCMTDARPALQSLKEFYQDQRGQYQSPTELELRVYHRLVHIRDQRERHDDIPQALLNHPVFELTTKFRARVQAKSAPITKTSSLVVDAEAMGIFAQLANVLRREGNVVMTYLVACILERHFGKGTIEDIESIRGDLSFSEIIDGYIGTGSQEQDTDIDISVVDETEDQAEPLVHTPCEAPQALQPTGTQWPTDTFGPIPTQSAFFKSGAADPPSQPTAAPVHSAFSNLKTIPNAFATAALGIQSAFTPQAEQSTQPPQVNGSTFGAAKTSVFASETPPKLLNPLAPNFTPTATSPSASGFGAPITSAFSITPPNSTRPPTDGRKSALPPVSKEPSVSIPQQPTQEQYISDATMSEIPFVSSPPSMDSTFLEGGMYQTPLPQPPPLNRRQPISLPSTPTATIFIPPSLPQTRKSTLKNLQTSSLSAVPTEILSPLVLHSPMSRSSMPGLFRRESIQSPLKAVVSATDIEGEAEPSTEKLNTSLVSRPSPVKKPSLDIMKATALHFARRSWLVKKAFSKWRQRLSDHAKWIEACRRSARYKEKAQAERLSRSVGGSPAPNGRMHRRTPSETRVPLKKRLRERLSGEYRPANDAELARRFEKVTF